MMYCVAAALLVRMIRLAIKPVMSLLAVYASEPIPPKYNTTLVVLIGGATLPTQFLPTGLLLLNEPLTLSHTKFVAP